jgi:ribosomal protein S12
VSKKKYRWNPYLRIKNQLRNNMATLNSILYKPRVSRTYKDGIKLLNKCPSKLGIVKKAVLRSPKKTAFSKKSHCQVLFIRKATKKRLLLH